MAEFMDRNTDQSREHTKQQLKKITEIKPIQNRLPFADVTTSQIYLFYQIRSLISTANKVQTRMVFFRPCFVINTI